MRSFQKLICKEKEKHLNRSRAQARKDEEAAQKTFDDDEHVMKQKLKQMRYSERNFWPWGGYISKIERKIK